MQATGIVIGPDTDFAVQTQESLVAQVEQEEAQRAVLDQRLIPICAELNLDGSLVADQFESFLVCQMVLGVYLSAGATRLFRDHVSDSKIIQTKRLAEVYVRDKSVYVITLNEYLYMNTSERANLTEPTRASGIYLWVRHIFGHELDVEEQWLVYSNVLSADKRMLAMTQSMLSLLYQYSRHQPYKTWLWYWIMDTVYLQGPQADRILDGLTPEQKTILHTNTSQYTYKYVG